MSLFGSVIEILRRLSLVLFTGFMGSWVTPEAMMLSQFVVSLFKVSYIIELSSHYMTDSVTNVQAFAQVYFKIVCCTFFIHFLLGL